MKEQTKGRDYKRLPYRDTKDEGSADFYYIINATFRFVIAERGIAGWIQYLRDMAESYYRPVWMAWRAEGLNAVGAYLQEAFQAEPGAVFAVECSADRVTLQVRECPAIKHLRLGGREIVREFCQHCYYQYGAMAEHAGLHMQLQGGNGSCQQTISTVPLTQNLNEILPAQ